MKRTVPIILVLLLSIATIAVASAATRAVIQSTGSAENYLPDPSMLDGDWSVTDQGERTKAEVADAIGANGDELLTSWQWRENFYEDLNRNDAASAPDEASFINVSVTRYANANGASEALTALSDIVVSAQGLQDVETPAIGDRARALAGPGDGVNLYVLYVQDGKYLLRLGGASATGDPAATVNALADRMVPRSHGPNPAVQTPSLSTPVAGGCWDAREQSVSDAGEMKFSTAPQFILDEDLEYSAVFDTSLGAFRVQLDTEYAPTAANNFVCLAQVGFYDGTVFFRTLPGLLIQGGDPTGTGTGNPGYDFEVPQINTDYAPGTIAFANAAPDQNGSQFFIAVTDLNDAIAHDFPVFGLVIAGMDVVEAIADTEISGTLSSPAAGDSEAVILNSVTIESHAPVAGPIITPTLTQAQIATAQSALVLDAKDLAFDPTEITIRASDEPVTFEMQNTGAALHNFSIDSLDVDVDSNPGETVDIVIPAGVAPGVYDFFCNVPGHKEAGMVGKLIVH